MDAVLFDLDGTLLDIDIDAFMRRYLAALSQYTDSLYPDGNLMEAIMAGVARMMDDHPGRTNQDAFFDAFQDVSGIDLHDEWQVFDRFYEEHFDGLRGDAGPRPGAVEALEAALGLDLKVAIATNPMFPMSAIRIRMGWAGVDEHPVDLVTSYEEYRACKPRPAYFQQIADALGVDPARCLMVGDDPQLDLAAAAVGMRTFYVGSRDCPDADLSGDMWELSAALPDLAAR